MGDKAVTGIYIVPFTNGLGDAIDISSVKSYAKNLPGVAAVWDSADFSLIDPVSIGGKIKEKNIDLMVLAGDMPGFAKSFFSSAMAAAGKDPANVKLASFNENGALTARDTEKAKAVVACAVHGIPFETAAVDGDCTVHPDTLVIGGGIAGIQASLEIADSGHKVYLVEKTATIGGHMAMFDKTFPTLDCAACILTPKMVEVGQHTNIDLMTYCEISGISGTPGNYKVSVLKKARRVNLATCIGCGICAEKCPEKVASEFDSATILRKAIYIPFPQAVPNKYLIDAEHCSYVQSNKCGVCAKVCPVVDCINYDEKDEVVEITVGNIIVATGFNVFDAKRIENFGYGKFPNVVTSLEFERLVNAAGPTGGAITTRTQDKKGNWIFLADSPAPKSIALIHCVGSRDENYNKYCSKVCCMYSLKLAHLVTEKLPDAKVYEYYIDMRAFGKGYEEFYERIKGEGVNIIRGRTAKVEEKNKKLLIRSEDIEAGKLIEQEVDMVILAVGLEPRQDAGKIAGMLGISQTRDGWFSEMNYISDPVGTYTAGISIAGLCQGPKDIPDTVAQASAAASRVIQSIINGKMKTYAKDINVSQIEKHVTKVS